MARTTFLAMLGAFVSVLAFTVSGPTPARAGEPGFQLVQRVHPTMGTLATVMVWTDDAQRAEQAIAEAFEELDRVDALMTSWGDESDVARLNAAAGDGKWVAISEETKALLERARQGSAQTGGAFDITVGSFKGLWKFDQDKDGSIPAEADVKARARLVRWRDVLLHRKKSAARLRRKGQRITLGGIAKGYALDRATEILRKHGNTDFILQAGGDMFVSGLRGDRRWRVGIRDPRSKDRAAFFAFAEVEDRTFSTSGDYERSVIVDGKRYHHILDPRTGFPATRSRSVTVMAKDAVTADVLSTGLFVLGVEKGMPLVEKLPDVEAVFVDAQNQVHVSSGLEGKLKIVKAPTDGI